MFRAIGFVITIIALRLILPTAFDAFEHTAVTFFHFVEEVLAYAPTTLVQDLSQGIQGQQAGVLPGLEQMNFVPAPAPLPAAYRP